MDDESNYTNVSGSATMQNVDPETSECQRPNHRLLRLAKLNQEQESSTSSGSSLGGRQPNGLTKCNGDSQETIKISSSEKTKCQKDSAKDFHMDVPPPSYESVVKYNPVFGSIRTTLPSSTSSLPRYADVGGLSDAPPSYHSLFSDAMLRAIHPFNSEDSIGPTSSNPLKASTIIVNVVLFILVVGFVFLLPISMITMGIIYVHRCAVQPRLPIYLIVLGFFQMLECCGRLAFKLFPRQNNRTTESWRDRYRRKDPLIYFVVVWFIIGSMWVYQTDPYCRNCPRSHHGSEKRLRNTTEEPVNVHSVYENLNRTVLPVRLLNHHQQQQEQRLQQQQQQGGTAYDLASAVSARKCDETVYVFAFWVVTSYYSVVGFFFLLVLFDVVTRVVARFCCPARLQRRRRYVTGRERGQPM